MKRLITAILILLTGQAWGATYHINPDAAGGGDGSESTPYNACPTITANNTYLFIRGTATANSLHQAPTFSGTITLGAYGTGTDPIISYNGNYILQLGTAVTGLTCSNIKFSDFERAIYVTTGGSGVTMTLDTCEFTGASNNAVSVAWAGNVEIKNCNFHDNAVDAINFLGPGYLWAHNNVFTTNGTSGTGNIDTISCQGTGLIEYNTITNQLGSNGSGIDAAHNTGTCTIRYNTLITGEGHGFGMNGDEADVATHEVIAYSNYISGYKNGAYLYNYGTYRLYNNTFVNCTGYGIRGGINGETNYRNMYFYNNIISGDETIKISLPAANGYTMECDYNCLREPAGGTDLNLYLDGAGHDTLAAWQEHGFDTHSITTDPLILSGYVIANVSPCKNAGTTLASVTTDIRGVARPQGAAYDIGCYEFNAVRGTAGSVTFRNATVR